MRVNLNSVMGVLLMAKNLFIILLLMVMFQVSFEELNEASRLMYVVGVLAVTVGTSCLELRLLDWIVKAVRQRRRG